MHGLLLGRAWHGLPWLGMTWLGMPAAGLLAVVHPGLRRIILIDPDPNFHFDGSG